MFGRRRQEQTDIARDLLRTLLDALLLLRLKGCNDLLFVPQSDYMDGAMMDQREALEGLRRKLYFHQQVASCAKSS